jgi:hypothetical protein
MFAHSLVIKRINEQQAVAYKSSDSFSMPNAGYSLPMPRQAQGLQP